MSLYNLKSADGDWRITKFTNDLDVESSYLVSRDACECPAGHRPSCRHRQMLPRMLAAQAEDSPMFYDFDNDRWLAPTGLPEILDAEPAVDGQTFGATLVNENECPGHVASASDPKVCAHCGTHIDSLRPDDFVSEALSAQDKPSPAHPQGTIRRRL